MMRECVCAFALVLMLSVAARAMQNVSVIRKQLSFEEIHMLAVDSSVQYILDFIPSGDQGFWPTRVWLRTDGSDTAHPLLVTARRRIGATTWQLPYYIGDTLLYEQERTLCPDDSIDVDAANEDCGVCESPKPANRGAVSVHVGASCVATSTLWLRLAPDRDWRLPFDKPISVHAMQGAPRVHYYHFVPGQNSVRLVVESQDDVCSTIAIQAYTCPIAETIDLIETSTMRMTVLNSGGAQISSTSYPRGFYVIALVCESDEPCREETASSEDWLWEMAVLAASERDPGVKPRTRAKTLTVHIKAAFSIRGQYLIGAGVSLALFVLFYLVFGALVLAQRWPKWKRLIAPKAVLAPKPEEGTQSEIESTMLATPARRRRDTTATFDSSDNSDTDDEEEPQEPVVTSSTVTAVNATPVITQTNDASPERPRHNGGHVNTTFSVKGDVRQKSAPDGGGPRQIPKMDWSKFDIFSGSFEKCSLITAALTQIGFYLLMFLGFVNQLIFKPKVATEKSREKSAPHGGGPRRIPKMDWSKFDTFPGSFEKCSVLTAALTQIGFYLLMFLGFVNQLIFKPKVATEKNREKSDPDGGGPRQIPKMDWSKFDIFPGSFEKCSVLTAALTQIGFYLLMFLGFVNQLIFKPKVATEKNREKSAPDGGGPKQIPKMDWSKFDIFPGSFEKCSVLTAALTQIGFYLLMFLGFVNQLIFKPKVATEKNREGYAPLYNNFETFYSRYVYRRVRHCFNRPICSVPGAQLTLKEMCSDDHNWSLRFTGTERRCINLGSFNYLGSAEDKSGDTYADVAATTRRLGLSVCSPRAELGEIDIHRELERTTAQFLGVEAAIVVGMGFATNTLVLPGLLGPDTLVLSDAKNHMSLILGLRLSRATVRVFRHNDVRHLEELARRAVAEGKWKKIVVVVEGIYSMEGSIFPLKALVALKKRYGLQIYIDEAHSIGAIGPRGRGVTDYAGVDPNDVDVLMGTFSKSFGGAGGYIAGSRKLISWIRAHGHAHTYAYAMAPPVAQQVLSAMRLIDTDAGRRRVQALKDNTHYFRDKLTEMGMVLYGHHDSPVVPMLVYTSSKMAGTVERLTARNIATVGVGFPATPLYKARIRFCLSASHSRAQLDECLAAVREVADELGLHYSRRK